MPSKRPFRVTRDVPGGINPGKLRAQGREREGSQPRDGRNAWAPPGAAPGKCSSRFPAVGVMPMGCRLISNTSIGTVSSIIETDHGEVLHGKTAATEIINDWALDYGAVPGAPHSRGKVGADGKRRQPRQAFNIVLSMPAGTPPQKVLQGGEEVRSRGIRASASLCDGPARRGERETRHASARASGGEGGA